MLTITPIPCLKDNYAYLLIDLPSQSACAIDPSSAAPIINYLTHHSLTLTSILCTHHHHDHVGGNLELIAWAQQTSKTTVPLYASDYDAQLARIPGQTHALMSGDTLQFAKTHITAWHVPGHTLGALVYQVKNHASPDFLLTGDTLFNAGCGRLFEGTAQQLFDSLKLIANFSPETLVYPGHEYTWQNLHFALEAEPHNLATQQLLSKTRPHTITIPSSISQEQATNPFLRAKTYLQLAQLREWKDSWSM